MPFTGRVSYCRPDFPAHQVGIYSLQAISHQCFTIGPMPTGLRLLTRGSWSETQRFAEILRKETVGGVLLLVAAGAA